MSTWYIHEFECDDCGQIARADRAIRCFKCGGEMSKTRSVGEIEIADDEGEVLRG